jgi:MFS family permease
MLGIAIGLYSLLLNLHLLDLGLSEDQIGTISSFGSIVMGVVAIPCGMLAGRFGRKRLLVLGLALMACGYAVFAAGEELGLLILAQFLQAVGLTMLVTTEIQLLYSYSKSRKEETQGFSLLFAIFTLFMGVGTLAGGYLPGWIGGFSTGYQGTLFVAAGFMMAGAMCRWFLLPKESLPPKPLEGKGAGKRHAAFIRDGNKRRWRLPGKAVWIFCGMNLLIGIAAAFTEPLLNVIVKFRLGWGAESISLLLTLNGFGQFLSSFLLPPLLDRLGFRMTYRLVFAANLITTLVLAAAMPAGMFSILLLAKGGAFIMLTNMVQTHSMSVLPEQERNVYAGLRHVIRSMGGSAAIYLTGVLLSGRHYGLPFLFAGLAVGAGCVYYEKWVKPLLAAGLDDAEKGQGARP